MNKLLRWGLVVFSFLLNLLLGSLLLSMDSAPPRVTYDEGGYLHIFDLQANETYFVNTDPQRARSPDGRFSARLRQTDSRSWELVAYDAEIRDTLTLAELTIVFPPKIAWSPDSRRIAFHANAIGYMTGPSPDSDIYTIDIFTGAIEQLTDNDYRDDSPHWSPDGRRIVFNSIEDGYNRLHVLDLETGERQLLTTAAYGYSPRWSPDGSMIAFLSNHEATNQEVYVVDVNTHLLWRVTHTDADEAYPGWLR